MGDAQAPGGYFVGRPANYEEQPQDAADSQNRGSAPAPAPAPAENLGQQQGPAPSSGGGGQTETGFFGNLLSCFCPGGRAES